MTCHVTCDLVWESKNGAWFFSWDFEMAWTEYKRTDTLRGQGEEFVSLRPLGVAFSTEFIQAHDLAKMTRVSLVVDHEARRLGFRFHSDEKNPDAFAVGKDGRSSGRYLNSKRIYSDLPWLGAALKRARHERRFRPKLSHGIWFIDVPEKSQKGTAR